MQILSQRTAAFVSLGVLRKMVGHDQGSFHYDDSFSRGWWKNAEEVNDSALGWLKRNPSHPVFLWISLPRQGKTAHVPVTSRENSKSHGGFCVRWDMFMNDGAWS